MSSGLKIEERSENEFVSSLRHQIETIKSSTDLKKLVVTIGHALVLRQLSGEEAIQLGRAAEMRAGQHISHSTYWYLLATLLKETASALAEVKAFDDLCKEVRTSSIFRSIVCLLSARPQNAITLAKNVFYIESDALVDGRGIDVHLKSLEELEVVEPAPPSTPAHQIRKLTARGHRIAFVLGLTPPPKTD